MGGLSFTHVLLLTMIGLVIFGPSRLPSLGKSLGEAIRGFKKGLNGDEEPPRDVTASTPREQIKEKETTKSI